MNKNSVSVIKTSVFIQEMKTLDPGKTEEQAYPLIQTPPKKGQRSKKDP
jgi:hypothetical protein